MTTCCMRQLVLRTNNRAFFRLQSTNMSSSVSDVILETVNNKGVITLNRPKALNALSLPMIRHIYPQLKSWEGKVDAVLIKGTGGKAFCAGGDIRALLDKTPEAAYLRENFFKEEYILNNAIGTLPVPYIALIDGITMGGGVGLSVHGTYRVATEKTLFAMPETAIGLFPDVGGSYFLSRLQGQLGVYLSLTGFRLKGADVHKAGIATHYVTSDKFVIKTLPSLNRAGESLSDSELSILRFKLNGRGSRDYDVIARNHRPCVKTAAIAYKDETKFALFDDLAICNETRDEIADLEKEILALNSADKQSIGKVLDGYHSQCTPGGEFVLEPLMEKINKCFGAATTEQIVKRLEEEGSEWAQKQVQTLVKMSPTSMKITHKQVCSGRDKNLQECLQMEYRLSQRFMEDSDFFEGVRAVLVDRDNNPSWKPATLEEVTDQTVERYFSPLPAEKELVL